MATREEIFALAGRLAKHENFSPDWLIYPTWAGAMPDAIPCLEKAKAFREQAQAILEGSLPPPAWLAEEAPAFREEPNKSGKNPSRARRRLSAWPMKREPSRRTPQQKATIVPNPEKQADTIGNPNRRGSPPMAAWSLRALPPPRSPPQAQSPPPPHPPP